LMFVLQFINFKLPHKRECWKGFKILLHVFQKLLNFISSPCTNSNVPY
jgi:hypothetical protein